MNLLLSIIGGLLPFFGSFVGRIVTALGFGFVQYAGVKTLFDAGIDYVNQAYAGVQSSAVPYFLEWAGFLRIDVHLSIIISALGARMALQLLNGDSVRRLVQRGA